MNRKKILLIAAAVLAVIAAAAFIGSGRSKDSSAQKKPAAEQPLGADIENAAFRIDGGDVPMTNGYSIIVDAPESAAATVTRFFGAPVSADLDADGDLDAAVLLTRNAPGSGTFFYAAAVIKEEEGYRGTDAFLLGDRVSPQNIEVHDGLIVANYADRKPGEPMTARTSVGVSRYFRVEGGELKEIEKP